MQALQKNLQILNQVTTSKLLKPEFGVIPEIPRPINLSNAKKETFKGFLGSILLQECRFLNEVVKVMQASRKMLKQAINGDYMILQEVQPIIHSLANKEVPVVGVGGLAT